MHSTRIGTPAAVEHPSGSPLPELARAITAGAVRLAAATAAWLRLIAEFDERGGWHGYGIKSCGHWLAWQCGLSPGAAREHVRVARALRGLPRIEAAFAAGRLSYSKVRALTRIAEPDSEASLLDLALQLTASQTERTVRQWRRADVDPEQESGDDGQSFEFWWDETGMLTVKARLRTEEGAALMAAIDSLAERDARRERALGKKKTVGGRVDAGSDDGPDPCATDDEDASRARERIASRRIAALASLAEARADADRRAGDPPRREVVVYVDATVLADDAAAGRAYLEGGPALTPAQARRMMCEATVVTALEKDREPLALGRRRRRATKTQRRALFRREGGCARPGCPENRIERLHVHHLRHWLFGGGTDLANLVLLCDSCHGFVHEHDLVLTRRGGTLVVVTPDGHRVWGAADAAFSAGLAGLDAERSDEDDAFAGVHPVDGVTGRRPLTTLDDVPRTDGDGVPDPDEDGSPSRRSPSRRRRPASPATRRRGRRRSSRRESGRPGPVSASTRGRSRRRGAGTTSTVRPGELSAAMAETLFPAGPPPLPEEMQVNGERMDVRYVVGVLMGNRDLARRLAAESGAGAKP